MLKPNTWRQLAAVMDRSRSYWIATTGSSGAPHVAPVWGAAHEGRFFLYSSRGSRKVRNLSRDPRAALHLPSTEEVVIVHGILRDRGRPQEWPDVLQAFEAKYSSPEERSYLPSADESYDVLLELEWRHALGWSLVDYEQSLWRLSRDSSADK